MPFRLTSDCTQKSRSECHSDLLYLHQHPHGIFQEPSERLRLRLCRFCAVADAVVSGDGGFHAPADFDLTAFHKGTSLADAIANIAASGGLTMAMNSSTLHMLKFEAKTARRVKKKLVSIPAKRTKQTRTSVGAK